MQVISVRNVLLVSLLASHALAQSRPPAKPPRPQPKESTPARSTTDVEPPKGSYKEQRIDAIDEQLAGLLQRRGETGVDQTILELQIDLRLLARGIASTLPAKLEAKPEAAAAYLRLQQVLRVGEEIVRAVPTLSPPTEPQAKALKSLHALTYRPALEQPSVAALDGLCKEIATALSTIVPAPAVEMRPQRAVSPSTAPASADSGDGSLATLSNTARRLNVTPGLRRQILTLTNAANAASTSGDASEASVLAEGLSDAVDLAAGLAANTAVAMATRQEIEAQLSQGLALFTDPRTRDIGRKRLETLAPYRQTLARVGRIKQSPDTQKLAKLFVWAQENPEDGPKVLSAVEAYNRVAGEFEERPRIASLPPNVKRAADATVRQFQTARATFMEEATGLADGGMMAATPKQLADTVREMASAMAQLDLIETSPRSLDAVLAFKPRPIGALEKRVIAAVAGAAGEGKMSAEDAVAFLKSLRALADAATRIGTDLPTTATGSPAWMGKGPAALQTRLNAMLTEAASALASPDGEVSPEVLAQLAIAGDLVETLRQAKEIDEAVAACAPLARWADWGVEVPQLEAILKPYRDGTAAAVDGLIDGSSGAVEQWPRMRQKYRPLTDYLEKIGVYAPACAALPEGAASHIAALATPFDSAGFASVRVAGATLHVWGAAELVADITTATEASALLAQQLRPQ